MGDLLFPLRCAVCDQIVPGNRGTICKGCRGKFMPISEPWCMKCGRKMTDGGEFCRECREGRWHSYDRARAALEYSGCRESLYRFKYADRQEYAMAYAELMERFLGDFIRNCKADGLVPIPLHPKRLRRRGYNQAGVLAKELGERMGIPVYDNYLLRVKNTDPLKNLNRKERQNNLKKAFLVKENDVKLKTIIIVDDIYTTGSTVDEAAEILRKYGAQRVFVVTLAGSGEI